MRILGLDTSTWTASAALVELSPDGSRVLATRDADTSTPGDVVVGLVDALCTEAGVPPGALDAIAVGAGPGSFTGLRIGLATGKGLAFALDRPLWLVSSLAALAASAGEDGVVAAALDARRGELYAGVYDVIAGVARPRIPEAVLAPTALAAYIAAARGQAAVTVVGDALTAHADALTDLGPAVRRATAARATPSAVAVVACAAAGDRQDHLASGVPSYLRRPEAEVMYPDGVPGALPRR